MSRKYKFGVGDKRYFISFAVVYWIDLFIRLEYRKIMIDSWKFCQAKKGLEIYGWALMTSHAHMIIGSGGNKLEDIVRDMKSHRSSQLRKAITGHLGECRKEWVLWLMERAGKKNSNNNDWQLWQQHNNPIGIFDANMFNQKLEYIHLNPVVSGFVEHEENWLFSSARDYYGKKGLVELSYIV